MNGSLDEGNVLLWKQQVLIMVRSHRLEDYPDGSIIVSAKMVMVKKWEIGDLQIIFSKIGL